MNGDQRKAFMAEWNTARQEHVKSCPACKAAMKEPAPCYWALYREIKARHDAAR